MNTSLSGSQQDANTHTLLTQDLILSLKWIRDLYRLGLASGDGTEVARHVYAKILEHVMLGFRADSGSIAFVVEEGRGLELVAGIDLPKEVVGSIAPMEGSRMGGILKSGQPALLNGLLPGSRQQTRMHVNSAMCWPLTGESGVIGVLNINRKQTSEPYTEADLEDGKALVDMIGVVLENLRLHEAEKARIHELERMNEIIRETNEKLQSTQDQLIQSEKMASIGVLAAGVAHEINNPIGYINSNLTTLSSYLDDLLNLVEAYEIFEGGVEGSPELETLRKKKTALKLEYVREDAPALIDESRQGVERVKRIVGNLKNFSRRDDAQWQFSDLLSGLESSLNIAHNEIKYKAEVVRELNDIPLVECHPSQINQVLLNLLINAAQAIEDQGVITIRSGQSGEWVWLEVEDTGVGIPPQEIDHIFEPFFTTKPFGQGTGLGLSLSYGIVQRHGGRFEIDSRPGSGTRMRIYLPIRQTAETPVSPEKEQGHSKGEG